MIFNPVFKNNWKSQWNSSVMWYGDDDDINWWTFISWIINKSFWGEWCMNHECVCLNDVLCLFRSRSRGTRGVASIVRTALSRPRWVPSHKSLLVFVSSLREIYSATARTQSVSHFLSESQPVILITLGQNPPNRWKTASNSSGQIFI